MKKKMTIFLICEASRDFIVQDENSSERRTEMEENDEIRNYAVNEHRISYLINPTKDEMYVDFGSQVTDEERIEAASQVAMETLDHVSDGNKQQGMETMIRNIREYGGLILKRP